MARTRRSDDESSWWLSLVWSPPGWQLSQVGATTPVLGDTFSAADAEVDVSARKFEWTSRKRRFRHGGRAAPPQAGVARLSLNDRFYETNSGLVIVFDIRYAVEAIDAWLGSRSPEYSSELTALRPSPLRNAAQAKGNTKVGRRAKSSAEAQEEARALARRINADLGTRAGQK
jgi:hypothetical protein